MHGAGNGKFLFGLAAPGVLGRGQKVKYHKISITKSISKISIPNVVCSHKYKIQNTSDAIFSMSPVSCPRGWSWGCLGVKIKFRPSDHYSISS